MGRRLRVLIEDTRLTAADVAGADPGFDVRLCAGPGAGGVCPLVTEGHCALADCDVVVAALDGPWARSVRAAWAGTTMPVAEVDAEEVSEGDPGARLTHHLGAAVQRVWAPYLSRD